MVIAMIWGFLKSLLMGAGALAIVIAAVIAISREYYVELYCSELLGVAEDDSKRQHLLKIADSLATNPEKYSKPTMGRFFAPNDERRKAFKELGFNWKLFPEPQPYIHLYPSRSGDAEPLKYVEFGQGRDYIAVKVNGTEDEKAVVDGDLVKLNDFMIYHIRQVDDRVTVYCD
jgi:hypothetical protein